jgi:hypothetical protein
MRPEDRLQARVRMYLDAALPPPGWWSSIAMERKQSAIAGARLKARGCKAGLADVMIWFDGKFIAVELKTAAGVMSDPQRAFAAAMQRNKFAAHVVRSVEELHMAVLAEGVPVLPNYLSIARMHDAALAAAEPARQKPRQSSRGRVAPPSKAGLAAVARARGRGVFA